MGKFSDANWDAELTRKMRIMFDDLNDRMRNENPERNLSFEEFVRALDVDDKVTRRAFDFLVKETFVKNGHPILHRGGDITRGTVVLATPFQPLNAGGTQGLHFFPLPEGFLANIAANTASASSGSSSSSSSS